MKNKAEIYQALLDGETLVRGSDKAYLKDGNLFDENGSVYHCNFVYHNEWSIYEEPKLNITEADVGKRARLRNGSVKLIIGYYLEEVYPVRTDLDYHMVCGSFKEGEVSDYDIVEILD